VFTDDSYGNVARDLDEAWGGSIGAELANPDFVRLAEAYGVTGLRAKEPAEVGELVREAVGLRAPVLIEVPVGRMPRPRFFTPRRTPKRLDR
jgi:acetolactate synthase-1/2/3 large subunit